MDVVQQHTTGGHDDAGGGFGGRHSEGHLGKSGGQFRLFSIPCSKVKLGFMNIFDKKSKFETK